MNDPLYRSLNNNDRMTRVEKTLDLRKRNRVGPWREKSIGPEGGSLNSKCKSRTTVGIRLVRVLSVGTSGR